MSADLRRHVAYFGPREKVYPCSSKAELPNMPPNWRRILSQSHPFPIVGPFGNIYADMEHALIAFRFSYASSCPHYSELFRMEHAAFAKSKTCRRFGSSNGLSLLQTNPDDRIWFVVRDKCMFDVVYQRICRDVKYRTILRELVKRRYLPVYHVRTADASTYWGATMNKNLLRFTNKSGVSLENSDQPHGLLDTLSKECQASNFDADPSKLLLGQNRLGQIMVHAFNIYREVYEVGLSIRNITSGDDALTFKGYPATPLSDQAVCDHKRCIEESQRPPAPATKRTCTTTTTTTTTVRQEQEQVLIEHDDDEFVDRMFSQVGDDDTIWLTEEDFL